MERGVKAGKREGEKRYGEKVGERVRKGEGEDVEA